MTKNRIAETIKRTGLTLAGYVAMREVAKAHQMDEEVDRIKRQIAEYASDLANLIEQAVVAGMTPEEVDACSSVTNA